MTQPITAQEFFNAHQGQWKTKHCSKIVKLLMIDGSLFDSDEDLVELFYAESWLLIDHLMREPDLLAQFREGEGTADVRAARQVLSATA